MKKVLALVMVLALALTVVSAAMAAVNDSITINSAKPGETYDLYKLFDLIVDDRENPTSYSYKVNSAWSDFFTGAGAAYVTINTDGYVTAILDAEGNTATDSKDLATAAAAYAANNSSISPLTSVTVAAGETAASFTGLADGYYLITSTAGTFAMADTTPDASAVTITEKNPDDSIEKKVKEDSDYVDENDAQVGDTVEFKSKVTIQPRSINVKIHDTMDDGLTFNNSSIKIYTDEALSTQLSGTLYTILDTPDSGDTFTIKIDDAFAATATAAQDLYITYTAELNQNAVVKDASGVTIVDQKNKSKVTWGDGSSSLEDSTTTTTHKFSVFKYASGSTTNLKDAVFQLLKGPAGSATVVNLVKLDDTNYRVVDDTETGTAYSHANSGEINTVAANSIVSDFVTVDSGDIVIWGVDSDNDYWLHEVQAPKGFNLLTTDTSVTVDAGNATRIDVENNTGTELPATGGIGTTIFYVAGLIMVLGAATILIARRKADAE